MLIRSRWPASPATNSPTAPSSSRAKRARSSTTRSLRRARAAWRSATNRPAAADVSRPSRSTHTVEAGRRSTRIECPAGSSRRKCPQGRPGRASDILYVCLTSSGCWKRPNLSVSPVQKAKPTVHYAPRIVGKNALKSVRCFAIGQVGQRGFSSLESLGGKPVRVDPHRVRDA